MAKKNRSVKPAVQGAQSTEQEQQLDEHLDNGDVSESDEGTLSGAEDTGAVDGNPGVGEAGAEGPDSAAEEPLQEEGLVGDESDAKAFLEGSRHVGFVELVDEEGNPATPEMMEAAGFKPLRGATPAVATLDEASFMAELAPEGDVVVDDKILEQPGIEVTITSPDLSEVVQLPLDPPDHHYKDALLEQSNARLERPTINPDVVGQIGYAPEKGGEEDPQVEKAVEAFHELVTNDLQESLKSGELEQAEEAPIKPLNEWTTAALRVYLEGQVGKDPAYAWSRDQMLTWSETGAYPKKTHRGNWIYDARRTHVTKSWSANELMDFIDGNLVLDKNIQEHDVWEEAYRRWKAPVGWTQEAFREYVYGGTQPERTASGVLVDDRMRDQKQVHHLTYRELRAALLGEIKVPHKHEDLVSQLRKRLGLSENHSEQRLLEMLPNTSLEVSMDNTLLRAKLEEYQAAITRNPATMTEATAGACQGMLYKAVRAVIKREYNEFVEGWNIILDFVNEQYANLFTPEKRARGWSQVNLSKQQLQLFEDLLTVLIATREPGNRGARNTYNLEIVLRHLPEENERQNLFIYYSNGQ